MEAGNFVNLMEIGKLYASNLQQSASNLFTVKIGDEHVIQLTKEKNGTELRIAIDGVFLPNRAIIDNGKFEKIDDLNECMLFFLQQSKKPLQNFVEAISTRLGQNGGKLTDEQIGRQLDLRREFWEKDTNAVNRPRKVDVAILQCFSNKIVENCFKSYIDAGWKEEQLLEDPKAFGGFVKYVFDYAADNTDNYTRELLSTNRNRLRAITAILFHNRDALSVPQTIYLAK